MSKSTSFLSYTEGPLAEGFHFVTYQYPSAGDVVETFYSRASADTLNKNFPRTARVVSRCTVKSLKTKEPPNGPTT